MGPCALAHEAEEFPPRPLHLGRPAVAVVRVEHLEEGLAHVADLAGLGAERAVAAADVLHLAGALVDAVVVDGGDGLGDGAGEERRVDAERGVLGQLLEGLALGEVEELDGLGAPSGDRRRWQPQKSVGPICSGAAKHLAAGVRRPRSGPKGLPVPVAPARAPTSREEGTIQKRWDREKRGH